MNLGKSLTTLATAPARVGLAAADAGLGVAASAVAMPPPGMSVGPVAASGNGKVPAGSP